ncbi:hypothetical protein EBR61_03350, partial [bacterium]|nr:hypothetical protein [bacterium]
MNELFKNDITLDQENHKYILNSSPEFKFSSVTEFIHFFFEKFDQEKVAIKLINTNPKYSGKTLNEVLKEWGKGAERGTIVHNELEMYVKENIDPKHQMSITGVRWLKEKQKNEHNSFFSEVIVYSKELGIAGTIDLLVYNSEQDMYHLVDWKTNKRIDKNSKVVDFDLIFEGKKNVSFRPKIENFFSKIQVYCPYLLDYQLTISSTNSFPHSSGIASSASSMSALSLCIMSFE